jgi:hypothetical protein
VDAIKEEGKSCYYLSCCAEEGDEPRIVQQTKRNVTSDGVVQMRCNAGEAGDRGWTGRERWAPGRGGE